ncbi:MAG: hypothetical protein C4K60_16090 [Ideonella sp. MAG2]|nr:MAG: hypothetical protein C4K60_16090 [Ideonella sp. MAG2]
MKLCAVGAHGHLGDTMNTNLTTSDMTTLAPVAALEPLQELSLTELRSVAGGVSVRDADVIDSPFRGWSDGTDSSPFRGW